MWLPDLHRELIEEPHPGRSNPRVFIGIPLHHVCVVGGTVMADPAISGSVRCLDTAALNYGTEQRNQGNLPGTTEERRTGYWLRCETGAEGTPGWCVMQVTFPEASEDVDPEQIHQQVRERVQELMGDLPEPPYYQVIQNGGGHIDPMHRFTTEEDAEEYHQMRFGGNSERQGYLAYHRQNWGGLITRSVRKIQEPKVFCIVQERTGQVKYSGLLPSEKHRSDSASAYHNPTVWEKFEDHLPPFPDYIRDQVDQDARFCPEDYEGNQFQWHQEQVRSFRIEIQRPALFAPKYGDR